MVLITEAFWALRKRPNTNIQRVTCGDDAIDRRTLDVSRVKMSERRKAIDTRDKRKKLMALVPAVMGATTG